MPEAHLFMAEGRTAEQKRRVMAAVTSAICEHLDCPPEVVTVQIFESPWTDKMKGGKTFEERYAAKIPSGYQAKTPDVTKETPS